MTDNLTIGKRIAFHRKNAGFTQQEIAAKLGVSRSLVGQIEKDLTKPNLDFLSGFIQLTNIKYDDVLGIGVGTMGGLKKATDYSSSSPTGLARTGGLLNFFINIQDALSTLYEVYHILLDPIYEKMPANAERNKVKEHLSIKFKQLEIVKRHISKEILPDEVIEYIIESFLKSKEENLS